MVTLELATPATEEVTLFSPSFDLSPDEDEDLGPEGEDDDFDAEEFGIDEDDEVGESIEGDFDEDLDFDDDDLDFDDDDDPAEDEPVDDDDL